MIKRQLLLTLTGLIIGLTSVYSQVSTYSFSASSGVYAPITGGTVLGDNSNDDNNFNALSIGFNVWYNGASYNTFSVNANGVVALGNTVANSTSALSTGTTNNIVAGLNFDIESLVNGELRYETIGIAPNRTLVVQWVNYQPYLADNGTSFEFQIRISETTNQINVIYGSNTVTNPFAYAAQVGLRGNTNADFNNRKVAAGLETWATSIAGVTNADVCGLESTLVPAVGQTYSWTPPPAPVTPVNLTFSAVTTTGMTLNWEDNSTDEAGFAVYSSLDGINYTFVTNVPSTSTATTGTLYNLPQTGLLSSTLYYWQVVAYNATGGLPLSGSQATLGGTLCGTYTVGPTGNYTSLTAAFADVVANLVSCPVVFELQAAYLSSVETFPLNVPNMFNSPANTITVRPEIGATNLSITSASTQTVNFNNAQNVIFDGRPGGLGTNRELTLSNTSVTGVAVQFANNTISSGLNYIRVTGVNNSTTSGVVVFGTATTANSGNFITNSQLFDGATLPVNLIYASTGAGTNTATTINNNEFSNWFSPTAISAAILLNTNNSNWVITNNSFFQTATRVFTSTTSTSHAAIYMNSATNQFGHNISNNSIGGSAPLCGGTPYTVNGSTATASPRFVAIFTNGNGSASHTVNQNTITNFSLLTGSTATAPGFFNGIYAQGTGQEHIITNNTVGSGTSTGAIIITQSGTTSGGRFNGIYSTATGSLNISDNTIGGITLNTTAPTLRVNFYGIYQSGTAASLTIDNNLVGSLATSNSVVTAPSTAATGAEMVGIYSIGTITGKVISNNTVANITNQYSGTSTSGVLRGIYNTSGVTTISGNVVRDLVTMATGTGTTTSQVLQGITSSATTAGSQTVTDNLIYNLGQGAVNGDVNISGLTFTGSTTFIHNIRNNEIRNLGAPFNTNNPTVNGLLIYGGTSRVYNNMIALGIDALGASVTNSHQFTGIRKTSTTANTFLHNSVSIAGTGVVAGTFESNTYAFIRTSTGVDSLVNNIFSNTRSNGSSTATHYSVSINNSTTLTTDKNIYFGNGTGYLTADIGGTPFATLALYAAATGQDANSFAFDPYFISVNDLHINNAFTSILESRAMVSDITSDIDADVRPGPVGSVNGGATAPDIGADEFDGIPLALDMGAVALVDPSDSACYSANEDVRIRVQNFSTQAINFAVNPVTISSFTTGINPVVFPNVILNTGVLAPGASLDTLVATSYDMSALGTYNFRAYTTLAGDIIVTNDTMNTVTINIAPGTATSIPASNICNYDNVTLSLSGQTNGGSIQWEASTDFGSTWNNIVGATTTPYVVNPGDTTYYRVTVCGAYTSNVVMVEPTVVGDVVSADTSRCGVGPITLMASGPNNIYWFDQPTGGTPLFTGSSFNTNVLGTDTFYVSNGTGIPNATHTTNLTSNNGSGAVMFPIYAINTVTITGFDVNYSNTTAANWEVWYRPDNYIPVPGANTSNVGWTFIGSANVVGNGQDIPTPLPIPVNITIPAGQAYSFYIQETGSGTHRYFTGVGLGNVYNSNADFEFIEGHGGSAPFNCTLSPRVFSGNIHYKTGCESLRDTVIVTVNPAASISATANASPVCDIDTISLSVTSVNTSYVYDWTSTTALSSTTGSNIDAYPTAGLATFYVVAEDTANCLNYDSVTVQVNETPTGTLITSDDEICFGDFTTLEIQSFIPTTFANSSIFGAIPSNVPTGGYYDTLVVNNAPTSLQSGDIVSVCLDITHTFDGDLDIYLISPSGTQIELSTDNGGSGDNYTSTCFEMTAATPITAGVAPFTGSFIPEQSLDLFNGQNGNGAWVLRVADDAAGDVGTLNSWSITIGTNADFQWTSSPIGFSDTASIINVSPVTTTEYIVTITNPANGCSRDYSDTVVVNPLPLVDLGVDTVYCMNNAAGVTLDATGPGLTYTWQDNSTNSTYQVTLPGTYSVEVVDANGCVNNDTIVFTGVMPVQVSIDVDFTSTTTATLDAGPGFSSYTWNTAATSQTINISSNGTYVVQTTDVNNCITTDTVNIVFSLGVFNPDGSESFLQLYPNPSNGAFNVTIDNLESSDVVIDILDMTGRVVYNRYVGSVEGSTVQSFNMEDLRAGTYNLRVTANGKASTLRFIISK